MKYSEKTLPKLLEESFRKYGDRPALGTVGKEILTYSDLKNKIDSIVTLLESLGIEKGNKVAILSNNMPHWGVTYFAILTLGAVAVPLLPDFSTNEIVNILNHSESKAIFVSKNLLPKLPGTGMEFINQVISIEDFQILRDSEGHNVKYEEGKKPSKQHEVHENDLAVIIYTSGTTGKSKGVMLSHRNIGFNALQASSVKVIKPTDKFLSVLPLSHTYENTIGFILPLINGASVYYLTKIPSPSVLLPALQQIRPTVMLTVPLIIEKIFYSKIKPAFTKSKIMRGLHRYTLSRKILYRAAGKKLMKTFGGYLEFFGIGGAKLNPEVEQFLIEAKFPYAVGYGLTETAPLLAGFAPFTGKLQSTGPALKGVELQIHDPDPETGEGEIWARGPNVMMGYYKEPDLTREVITEDGWFRTGDLGIIDDDGYLFIRGRLKNVIIGPAGENIYPEEIEAVINTFEHVLESIVVEEEGKLVALVHFDREEIQKKYDDLKEGLIDIESKCAEIVENLKNYINEKVSRFSKVHKVVPHREEFVKTATKKIKRFLYTRRESKNEL